MINTVLGKVRKEELGQTRVHEHILWDWTTDVKSKFDKDSVIKIMLPHLLVLKNLGCNTLTEATPKGAGRDINVLIELSEKANINIIANCGVWDGLDYKGKYVPQKLINRNSHEVAELWINEYENGIENTTSKPGFIKIGLGDNDLITDLQDKFLNSAITVSKHTGLPILAHICSSKSAKRIVEEVKDKNLKPNKFVWSHADYSYDFDTIIELAKHGIWIELSWHIGKTNNYSWYIETINKMSEMKLLNQLLISQDAGGFHKGNIVSYDIFYTEFIAECLESGISSDIIDKLLVINPSNLLDN